MLSMNNKEKRTECKIMIKLIITTHRNPTTARRRHNAARNAVKPHQMGHVLLFPASAKGERQTIDETPGSIGDDVKNIPIHC